jgi:hypothetical protein
VLHCLCCSIAVKPVTLLLLLRQPHLAVTLHMCVRMQSVYVVLLAIIVLQLLLRAAPFEVVVVCSMLSAAVLLHNSSTAYKCCQWRSVVPFSKLLLLSYRSSSC